MSVLNLAAENAIKESVNSVGSLVETYVEPIIPDVSNYDYNLVNMSKVVYGRHISPDGTISTLSSHALTDYIRVSNLIYPSIKILYRKGGTTPTIIYGYYFFDGKHNLISYNYSSNEDVSIAEPITIPDNAMYVRLEVSYLTQYPQRLWIVMKYACFNTSWFDVKEYKGDKNGNLIDFDNLIDGFSINSSGQIIRQDTGGTYQVTPLIPVVPGKKYYTTWANSASVSSKYMFLYDGKKEFLSYKDEFEPYWTCPSNCFYVAFNVKSTDNVNEKTYGIFSVDDWDGNIGDVLANNNKLVASVTNGMQPCNGCLIIGVYENHLVIQRAQKDNIMYYSSNGWDGPFTTVDISSFDGYESNDKPSQVVFFDTVNGLRSLVFAINDTSGEGKLFCSTTGAFSGFEKSDFWDLKGSHHWRISDDDKDPTGQRYRKYYPTEVTNRQNRFMWHNGPVWFDGVGGMNSRGLAFANYTNNYVNNSEPSCLYYTEDGKNIYVQYEFGVYQKYYKRAADNTVRESVNYNLGDDLDCTSFSGTHSMSLKVRYNILPSSAETDPTNIFEYGNAITVSSISGKNFTLADASGLHVGDTVILTGIATGDYSKILNNEATATEGGQTAFVIKSISGSVITLADVIGNVRNNLSCRHIHGVTEFGQGICIYTGEEYPESWFIYISPYMTSATDGVNMNNSRWEDSVVRLNASENAFQRALGIYLRSDGKVVYAADSNSPYNKKLEVRGKEIKMGGLGLHIFDLANIDNTEGSLSKIQALGIIDALYYIAGVLFLSTGSGKTFYSTDQGDTWNFVCEGGGVKNRMIGFDKARKRFYFNTQRNEQFVIEFK